MVGYLGLLSVLLLGISRTAFAKLPAGVTGCSGGLSQNDFNDCVRKQVSVLTPMMAKGIPSMNLPALDPFYMPKLSIDRKLESLVIKTNLSHVEATGASNYVINDLDANPQNLTLRMKLHMPFIHVKGDYDVKGRLLLLVLNGIGTFKGNFTNTDVRVNARGKEVIDKNGVKRIEVDRLQVKVRVGHGNMKLQSPPAFALTAEAAQAFFNANPKQVLDIASPIIEDTAATISKALAVRALGTLTKDDLILK